MKSPRTVLCVSHDPDTCEILTVLLADADIHSEYADTPAEALRLLRARKYAAVITAYYLTDISGPEFCREFRLFDRTTPVIFYSGAASPGEIQQGLEAGAQAYLVKPDDLERLCETVQDFVEKAEVSDTSGARITGEFTSFA